MDSVVYFTGAMSHLKRATMTGFVLVEFSLKQGVGNWKELFH